MFKKNFLIFLIFISLEMLSTENMKKEENNNNKVVIFIHGIGCPGLHHPFVDFFKPRQKLSSINMNTPGKFGKYRLSPNQNCSNLSNYTFYWDREDTVTMGGILSKKGRYEAAQYLYKALTENQNFKNKEISIVGHSHGGNVATELLRVIGEENSRLRIKNLIFYETPKGELTERGIHTKVMENYVAENVFDINLEYKPDYTSQQQLKGTQVIDIVHQFPRCFRTFLKKRDKSHDIVLDGKDLNHNSMNLIGGLLNDLLNEDQIKENYTYSGSSMQQQYCFKAKVIKSFHANNPILQYSCYYILPYIIKATIIYKLVKLVMRYDKEYNLGIKKNLIYQINLVKKK